MISAQEALTRLREGNERFCRGESRALEGPNAERIADLAGGQSPLAIILGCSDSRVPAELVFDQGLGDLFVIRVAGNIVAPSQVGSVEFAATAFGTPLVVVLGHSSCGAVLATLADLDEPPSNPAPGNVHSIVSRVRPAVQPLWESADAMPRETLVERAIRANVLASVNQLRHGSPILEERVARQELRVVGAEYSLETGVVDFFE